jgi:hypothetical protein
MFKEAQGYNRGVGGCMCVIPDLCLIIEIDKLLFHLKPEPSYYMFTARIYFFALFKNRNEPFREMW